MLASGSDIFNAGMRRARQHFGLRRRAGAVVPCPAFPRPINRGFSHADLGCGARRAFATVVGHPERAANIGIDQDADCGEDVVPCVLGLEPIPVADNSQDLVTAYDLLEHIPRLVAMARRDGPPKLFYPTIDLMNEVFRVLKPGGLFEALVPGVPFYLTGAVRDPTHVSLWCLESFDYFCSGRFQNLAGSYGITAQFEKLHVCVHQGSHVHAVLEKPLKRQQDASRRSSLDSGDAPEMTW